MYARGYYICLLVNGHQLAIAHTMYLRVRAIFEFQVWIFKPQIRKQMCLETHLQYENSVLGRFGQSGLQKKKSKLP